MMFKVFRQSIKSFLTNALVIFVPVFNLNSSASAQTASTVEELVKSLSGGTLQVETKAAPYKLVADFDGDKIKDVAVIVSLADTPANVAKNVKVQYPYYSEKEVSTDDLALFIIHGKDKGWEYAQKSSVLFLGRNSALIFQRDRLGESGEKGNNWEIKKDKRGKSTLFFGTEASSGTLQWNGKKYVWTESEP